MPSANRGNRSLGALEQVLALAASDKHYAEELATRPEELIRASGLSLTDSERHTVAAVGGAGLRRAAGAVGVTLSREHRRMFLRRAGEALAVLVGGTLVLTGQGCKKKTGAPETREPAKSSTPTNAAPAEPDLSAPTEPDLLALAEPGPPDQERHPGVIGLLGSRPDSPGRVVGIGSIGARPDLPELPSRVPRAQIRMPSPEVAEGMDQEATTRIIRRSLVCIQAQYQRGLKRDPSLVGKIAVCLQVDPLGRVASVELTEDTVYDPLLAAGVKACLVRLRFGPPGKAQGVPVCFPIWFEHQRAEDAKKKR